MSNRRVFIILIMFLGFSFYTFRYIEKNYSDDKEITSNEVQKDIINNEEINLDEEDSVTSNSEDVTKNEVKNNDAVAKTDTLEKSTPTISEKNDSITKNTITDSTVKDAIVKTEKVYPTLSIKYDTLETTNFVTLYITTEKDNLISYNNEEWTSSTNKEILKNVVDYSIRVKNNYGLITEKKITISNIREKSKKEENDELISNIQNTYSVNVSYGDGTYCWYNGNSCTILYDEEVTNTALKKILSALGEFPSGFFKKFVGVNGYRIEMFDDIPGDTAGLASYEIGDDNVMFIDANTSFVGRVFYHETFHIMEQYMYIMNNWNTAFDKWSLYNPSGFTYGDTSSSTYVTVIDTTSNKSDITFISYYAKTNEREDRAELFADLMFRPYKKEYMNSSYGVNEKAKYLVSVIRNYWKNSTGAKWERWITF